MNTLIINDLEMNKQLDSKAMQGVRGSAGSRWKKGILATSATPTFDLGVFSAYNSLSPFSTGIQVRF